MDMVFASCKDSNNKIEYLVADTERAIEDYCRGRHIKQPDLLFKEKAIMAWYTNPTPIMVAHHFEWVGKGRRPPILSISKPHDYSNPTKRPLEKW
jgi:hypothetical protein